MDKKQAEQLVDGYIITYLEEFYLGNNFFDSLEPLKNLTRLKSLGIFSPNVDSGLEYLTIELEKIYLHSENEEDKSLAIWEELKNYPTEDNFKFTCYDYQAWRKDNAERIELANIDKITLFRQFKSLREEYFELQKKFNQLQGEMESLERRVGSFSPIIINNLSNSNTAFFNNQIIYQIKYDESLANREIVKIKEDYKNLENSVFESSSNSQKLKKTILFLAAQQILATQRQETINSLITTYNQATKDGKKYDQIKTTSDFLGQTGGLVTSFVPVPGLGAGIKTLNQGITILTDFLKNRSFKYQSVKFEDYLIEDEKTLTLLQETYQTLSSSLNIESKISPLISQMLRLNQNLFEQHGVFSITNLQKDSHLKKEDIQRIIDSLTTHLGNFIRDLQQETDKHVEQLESVFSDPGGDQLQQEVEELLNKLSEKEANEKANNDQRFLELKGQITQQEQQLEQLVSSVKDKLKNRFLDTKTKENHRLLEQFLVTGFIDSKLASVTKDKKINLSEITNLQNFLKNLQKQLNELNSEQLENQVVQLEI